MGKKRKIPEFVPKLWWICVHCGYWHGPDANPPYTCDYCGHADDFDNVYDVWRETGRLPKLD